MDILCRFPMTINIFNFIIRMYNELTEINPKILLLLCIQKKMHKSYQNWYSVHKLQKQ